MWYTSVLLLIFSTTTQIQCRAFPVASSFRVQHLKHFKSLQVRGGETSPLSATSSAVNAKEVAEVSTQQRYYRIAKELGRHVWPSVPSKKEITSKKDVDVTTATNLQIERKKAISIRYRVIVSLLLMLAGKGVTIATPYIFKALIDIVPSYVGSSSSTPPISSSFVTSKLPISLPLLLLISYGICRSLSSFFREATSAVFAHVSQYAIRRFGRKTFDHVHSLDLSYHLNRNTGALSRVLERGSRSISLVLNAMVFSTIPILVELGVVLFLLFKKFGVLHALTVLLTIGFYSAYTIFITQWRSSIRKDMIALENQASGKVSDSLLNYETVKYFGNEVYEGHEYENTLQKYQKSAIKASKSLSALNFGQTAIFSIGLTIMMGLTLQSVKVGKATVGDLVLVNGLLFQLSVPLNFIGWVYQETRQAFIDMEATFELLDTVPEIVDRPDAVDYDPVKDGTTIELEDIEFGYKTFAQSSSDASTVGTSTSSSTTLEPQHEEQIPTTRPILKKATFTIPQGKTVAIVGSSGCGKSTLLRILYRFYNQDKGTMRLGGKDISAYTTSSVRKAMAIVPQDVVLFNDSIGYNIQYGNLNASWEEVVEATKRAQLHEIIIKLPDGYNTIVGERGLKLSGGEKQRVSLARAILKKSPILLCDEPTSSLDMQTELEIMNNLKEIANDNDVTGVIIAHRLSTIQDCDIIVVMDEGKVIEQGTHDELLRLGGRYSELVAFQRSTSTDESSIKQLA